MGATLSTLALQRLKNPAAFQASLTTPYLVWEAPSTNDNTERWAETAHSGQTTRPSSGEPLLMPVQKAAHAKNAFAMGVTIGRVDSNDVVIDDPSVSRFHAYLQHDARRDVWRICDADSSNGTWLDGVPLASGGKQDLADGTALKLGEVQLKFLLPAAVLALIDRELKRGG